MGIFEFFGGELAAEDLKALKHRFLAPHPRGQPRSGDVDKIDCYDSIGALSKNGQSRGLADANFLESIGWPRYRAHRLAVDADHRVAERLDDAHHKLQRPAGRWRMFWYSGGRVHNTCLE